MTTAKITALAAVTAVSDDDLVMVIDAPGGSAASKKVTFANFLLSLFSGARNLVINEYGNSQDTRVEGDTDENLVFVDGSADRVGIGVATPAAKLDVNGTIKVTGVQTLTGEQDLVGDLVQTGSHKFNTQVVEAVFTKTAIVDNTATAVFNITTTDEAGNTDGGGYTVMIDALAMHNGVNNGDNAAVGGRYSFSRAQQAAGTGQLSAVVEAGETLAAESEGGTTKGIASVTCTVTETSEYITAVKFTVDLDGTAVTTAVIVAHVKLIWYGYLHAPTMAAA